MMYPLISVNRMSTFLILWYSIQVIQQVLLQIIKKKQTQPIFWTLIINLKFIKYDTVEKVWCKKGMILLGVNGKLPSLPSDNTKRSSLQSTACENTQTVDNVHNRHTYCNMPPSKNLHTWIKKKTSIYLQTKLFWTPKQLSTHTA